MHSGTIVESVTPRTSLGAAIPDTAHAVSVSLPTWRANVGYEEGHDWVMEKMKNGYPRFFIQPNIQKLADAVLEMFSDSGRTAFLFPTASIAKQCLNFIEENSPLSTQSDGTAAAREFTMIELILHARDNVSEPRSAEVVGLAVAVVPSHCFSLGKSFWQHSGEGISSRRADFLHQALIGGYLVPRQMPKASAKRDTGPKGPRRYQKDALKQPDPTSLGNTTETESKGYTQFIEERFGRNLDTSLANQAKHAIRKRISGSIDGNTRRRLDEITSAQDDHTRWTQSVVAEDDVYLYPSGMSAIFNSHRILKKIKGNKKSIMFGFPYIDTLKILEKFGAGALFYGKGSSEDLDDLEARCNKGETFLALYCEFPGNPLLITPNLRRIKQLSNRFGFVVVVDETIGNFLNVNVLPESDIVVSSLTKVFSGDSNVMGGSLTLNPSGQHYNLLKTTMSTEYTDNYWPEDAVYMERNSRDFVSRNDRINNNAEAVCDLLQGSSFVKQVYYPRFANSRQFFDALKNPNGGYGGLFSVTFNSREDAHIFFDALETEKGPSLGTNFTLSCPFVILAHYNELDWAAQFGVEADLVRVSVGLEVTENLLATFRRALEAIAHRHGQS